MVFAPAMSHGGRQLIGRAPAKVNLYLEVLGEHESGFHYIRSVVMPISVYDELVFTGTDGPITITTEESATLSGGMSLPEPAENLVTRAAVLLKQATGYKGGAQILLRKQIPIGGGLGGGSADAAAVLCGLNRLWKTGLSARQLAELGARLGSDVPALVQGGATLVEGIGEKVSPLSGAEAKNAVWWLVLLNPGFGISTGDIYRRFKTSLTSRRPDVNQMLLALRNGDVELGARNLFNDLEPTVLRKYPLIAILLEQLAGAGALGVLVSGSGSTVFGLARDESQARAIEGEATSRLGFPVWSRVAKTLPDGVMVAHGPLEARV